MFLSLVDWDQREKTVKDIVGLLNRDLFLKINEAQAFAFGPPAIPGLGSGSGFSLMLQDRSGGATPEFLEQQASGFIQAASQRPEIGSVFTTYRANAPQRFIDINRDKVLKANIALTMSTPTSAHFWVALM